MARVRGKDTAPELRVRRALHGAGLRYRLHARGLPGTPDLVFPSRRIAVFVHGCFWHRHTDPACKLARMPKSRLDFWAPKLARNAERDADKEATLRAAGWEVMLIWECETRKVGSIVRLADAIRARPQTQYGARPSRTATQR